MKLSPSSELVFRLGQLLDHLEKGDRVHDFTDKLHSVQPQFPIESEKIIISSKRYPMKVKVGGRFIERRGKKPLPESFSKYLVPYKGKGGFMKEKLISCRTDEKSEVRISKRNFLLAQFNHLSMNEYDISAWRKVIRHLETKGLEIASASDLLDFEFPLGICPLEFSPTISICSLESVRVLKGRKVEEFGYFHQVYDKGNMDGVFEYRASPKIGGHNDYVLLKEIL